MLLARFPQRARGITEGRATRAILRYPASPTSARHGSTSDVPVIGCDALPTMLALAGMEPPKDRVIDGVNVLPVLTGIATKVERPRPLYWKLLLAPNA